MAGVMGQLSVKLPVPTIPVPTGPDSGPGRHLGEDKHHLLHLHFHLPGRLIYIYVYVYTTCRHVVWSPSWIGKF